MVTHHIGILMKREELAKTFMMTSNWKKLWAPWFTKKYFSVVRGKGYLKVKDYLRVKGYPRRRWTNAGIILIYLLRRWPNIKPRLLVQRLVLSNKPCLCNRQSPHCLTRDLSVQPHHDRRTNDVTSWHVTFLYNPSRHENKWRHSWHVTYIYNPSRQKNKLRHS